LDGGTPPNGRLQSPSTKDNIDAFEGLSNSKEDIPVAKNVVICNKSRRKNVDYSVKSRRKNVGFCDFQLVLFRKLCYITP